MNTADIFNLFLLVSALHGFGFSALLFASKNGGEKSMRYLNLLILSISLNNMQSWALAMGLFQHKFALQYLQIPWHFLAMPFLYMFLIHYLDITSKTYNLLKVAIPLFLVAVIAQVSFVYNYDPASDRSIQDLAFERYTSIEESVSFAISISLFLYSYYLLYKKEKFFSQLLTYDNLRWIHNFFILSSLGYLLWIAALIIKFSLNFQGFLFSYYPLRIYTTILIYWLGYQGLRQVRILKERQTLRKNLNETAERTDKPTKPKENLKPKEENSTAIHSKEQLEKYQEYFEELDQFIRKEKKYLLTKYTLQNLAMDCEYSSSTLSVIINTIAQKSFIDYLNEMRVDQAKTLLTDSDYENYTITSIGLESGFNSKSTFYTVFKKHTGLTPVNYRNQVLAN